MNACSHVHKVNVMVSCVIVGYEERSLKVFLSRAATHPGSSLLLPCEPLTSDESAEDVASRITREIGNISLDDLRQFSVFSHPGDDGDFTLYITFFALTSSRKVRALLEASKEWILLNDFPNVASPCDKILNAFLKHLRYLAAVQPVGKELLPDKFTISQLRSLYEAIYDRSIDQRNFAKKVLSLEILDKLDEKDMISSRKGAYYYRFNNRYHQRYQNQAFS